MKKYCRRLKIRLHALNTNLKLITTFLNDPLAKSSFASQYMIVGKRLVKRGGWIFSSNNLLRHDAICNNNTVNRSYNKTYWEWCKSKHRSSNINMRWLSSDWNNTQQDKCNSIKMVAKAIIQTNQLVKDVTFFLITTIIIAFSPGDKKDILLDIQIHKSWNTTVVTDCHLLTR